MLKTKAAVLVEQNKPLRLMDLKIPSLQKGQVVVQMAYTGICRTQINEITGAKGPDSYLPHTLGHEGSGIVVECGEGVTKVKPGDAVIATWMKGNGLDAPKTIYQGEMAVNSGAISTFMDYAVISENRLIPISSQVSLKEAALFGCAIPTGAGIIQNEMKLYPEATLAIFGIGGIGASALLAASTLCAKLIAVDVEKSKLELAKRLGATHTIHAHKEDVLDAILQLTNGKGADFAIEAVGQKVAMETAFRSVRDKGGVCVLAGNTPKGVLIETDPFDYIKGKKLIGTWGGAVVPDRDIPVFLKQFTQSKSKLEHLISHTMSLQEINEACDLMKEGKAARILLRCSKEAFEKPSLESLDDHLFSPMSQ